MYSIPICGDAAEHISGHDQRILQLFQQQRILKIGMQLHGCLGCCIKFINHIVHLGLSCKS